MCEAHRDGAGTRTLGGERRYAEALSRLLESGYLERTQHPALGTTLGAYRLTEDGAAKAEELRGA